MGIRKTDEDIRLEDFAHSINAKLIGTGVEIIGGGSKGPFGVVISYLGVHGLGRVLGALSGPLGLSWADEEALVKSWLAGEPEDRPC